MSDHTEQLLARAQSGDTDAREELFRDVQDRVLAVVRKRMGPHLRQRAESVDIAQSVMGDALRDLAGFEYRGQGALIAWLAQIVENKLRREARQQGRDPRLDVEGPKDEHGEAQPLEPTSPAAGPATIEVRRDERQRVREQLQRLPDRYRLLIELRDVQGLSWADVARESGDDSVKAAQHAHARAKALLATYLSRADRTPGSEEKLSD